MNWRRKRGHLIAAALLTAFFIAGAAWPRAMMERVPSPCMFRLAFRHGCPGCGMTRSVTALLQGDVRNSIRMHLFGPFVVLLAGTFWVRCVIALCRANPAPLDFRDIRWTIGLAVFLVLYIGYWIYRIVSDTTP